MFPSTYPDDPPAEMDHSAQGTHLDVNFFPVDPIAHRPPGPFPHPPTDSTTHNPQTRHDDTYRPFPQVYSQAMSALYGTTSISGDPSYFQENTLSAATPSSSTSSLHSTSFPSPRYTGESWAPYNARLGSAPHISPEGHTQWTQPDARRPLNSHSDEGSPGAPQIYVTPDVHQPSVARPDDFSSLTLPSIPPPDDKLSFPPRTLPLTPSAGHLPYTPTDRYSPTRNESGFSEPFVVQPTSPSPQSSQPPTLHVLKVVQNRDLPRLETTRLEPRTVPSGNRWFIQTASPLLTLPEQHNGESRIPLGSPQQASPKSSTNSSFTSPSPSSAPSPITFVTFAPANSSACQHEITEDKSISDAELCKMFPTSSQGPMEVISPRGIQGRKWTCQFPGCQKSVRRQDRMAHALDHQGKKRYICNCGATFSRSQDQKRHLREQAVCRNCERAVGRNGMGGECSACSPKRRRRGKRASSVTDGNA